MKIIFSSLKNSGIFEDDFMYLSEQNGTIEFKRMQTAGGIAVVYAPNGTGKTSFANLLSMEVSEEKSSFYATDEHGNIITPETKSFHVIQDQLNRNVIRGETTDYLIGAQIRREYELRDQINSLFKSAFENLASKYKKEFNVSKVKDYLLIQMQSLTDQIHQAAYPYIRSIVNSKQHGKDIDRTSFVTFIRNNENRPTIPELNDEKKLFVVTDLSKAKIIEKILSINPDEVITDANVILVERHDDAIEILNKYHSLDSCIVCDNPSFNGDALLERKKGNRKYIYDNLDKKTKDILDKIVRDSSLIGSDPFDIKKIVGAFIAGQDSTYLIELQRELTAYVNSIGNEMIDELFHCFDGTSLFNDFDEYAQLAETQPQLDSEELLFIENVINENIGKNITIVRDEDNDRNYKLKIGDKDLLGTERKEMELSTGEQNFISLAFELLLARHSNKDYIVMDDPISSFDSVYKNKIAFCIIKFLENKKQIILTHNTDLIRLLDVQLNNCFNLYILNNVHDGENGFIPVSEREKKLLINLHYLIAFFQNNNNELIESLHNRRQFLMAMIPFIRGYAHICLDPEDYYGKLSGIMHGYGTESLDIIPIYNKLFGNVFEGSEIIGVTDVLGIDCNNLDMLDRVRFPLLADTLEQTLVYYHLRMKVEKELVDIFNLHPNDMTMLNQIIQQAFRCQKTDLNYERMREFRVFFTSRKTLLNEFNHFEGNMNIFQPAIDITKSALRKEIAEIEAKLIEIRNFENR
ncbi:AAA family ATPase [Candidatus Merdisoma sp. HCP28S3_D10]|uniref:AAA family ATPase n=1 Tax=unclassified Candidatus Merdisoma TaxID=3099611 RepID=UPI003F88D8B8